MQQPQVRSDVGPSLQDEEIGSGEQSDAGGEAEADSFACAISVLLFSANTRRATATFRTNAINQPATNPVTKP
jgi:hypothetical protein